MCVVYLRIYLFVLLIYGFALNRSRSSGFIMVKRLYNSAIKTYGCLDGQNKIKQSATGGNLYQQKSACKRRGKRRNARGHPKVASSLS
jgi:hypothetical protein